MATISSPGIGSGLDVNSIVSKLVAVESRPLQIYQKKASSITSEISAYGSIKSGLGTLQTATQALLDPSTWGAKTLVSASSAVGGTASSTAPTGVFSVQVSTLAQAQTVASGVSTAGAAIGTGGRLDIQLGTWSGTTFTAGTSSTASISVSASDTLSDIASKINAANAGVSARVVTGPTGQQLSIISTTTGAANGFQVRSFDQNSTEITDGTTGVGRFAFNSSAGAFYGMNRTQQAVDATGSINGISVSSSTNVFSNVLAGLSLTFNAITASPVQMTVSTDTASMTSKLQAFSDAYNSVNSTLHNLTKYDAATKTGGALLGDNLVNGLQTMLSRIIGANGPSGTGFSRLSDLGLQIQRDGSMTITSQKLASALSNVSNVKTFLSDASNSPNGILAQMNGFLTGALGSSGVIATGTSALQTQLSSNQSTIDRFSAHIDAYKTQLLAQYNTLDTKLGTLSSLNSYIAQQITLWNKSR